MATTRDIQLKIKVTDDGQAFVQIDRLGKGFVTTAKAAKVFEDAIKRQDPVLKGSVADYQRQIRALKLVRDNSAKTAKEFARQTKVIEQLQVKQRALANEITNVNKVNENQISNAGLAGATLTEFGRTISDLPYGIRGVANNISQLSTLFTTLAVKSGGVKNSIGLLIKQLRGPLGYVLAIQAVVAALDFFAGRSSKAKEETDDLTDSVSEQIIILKNLNVALKENNITRKQASDIARGALKQDKELKDIMKDQSLSEKEKNKRIIELAEKRQEELTLQDKINKKQAELVETEKELVTAVKERGEEIATVNALGVDTYTDLSGKVIELTDFLDESSIPLRGVARANIAVNNAQEKQKQQLIDLATLYGQQTTILNENTTAKRENQKVISGGIKALSNDFELMEIVEAGLLGITVEQLRLQKEARAELIESSKTGMDEFNKFAKDFLKRQEEIAQANALIEQFKIDTAYRTVDSIRSIGLILESLGVENRGVMVAAIIAEKAAAIGEMIIATTKSNRAIAAAGFAASAFNPFAGAFAKKLIVANKIGLGIDIAAVVAQASSAISKIGGPSGGGAGGAGGGSTIEAPDFNVVGASATNQLAESVAGQQSRPLRAFVVGKDISTQQELDRNINNTASFGG